MKRLANLVALVVVALSLGACHRTQPILNVLDEPLPITVKGAPLDEIGRQITIAAAKARWRAIEVATGHLIATIDVREHDATVDIMYNERNYSITLKDSTNLLQSPDGTIHRRYDSWIVNLRAAIDLQLATYDPPRR